MSCANQEYLKLFKKHYDFGIEFDKLETELHPEHSPAAIAQMSEEQQKALKKEMVRWGAGTSDPPFSTVRGYCKGLVPADLVAGTPDGLEQGASKAACKLFEKGIHVSACRFRSVRDARCARLPHLARNGDLEGMKRLAGQMSPAMHTDPFSEHLECKGADDVTLLLDAAMSERWDVVEWLLDQGADADATTPDGRTALHYACEAKPPGSAIETVKKLLAKSRKSANALGGERGRKTAALHIAVRSLALPLVNALLEHSADPNVFDEIDGKPISINMEGYADHEHHILGALLEKTRLNEPCSRHRHHTPLQLARLWCFGTRLKEIEDKLKKKGAVDDLEEDRARRKRKTPETGGPRQRRKLGDALAEQYSARPPTSLDGAGSSGDAYVAARVVEVEVHDTTDGAAHAPLATSLPQTDIEGIPAALEVLGFHAQSLGAIDATPVHDTADEVAHEPLAPPLPLAEAAANPNALEALGFLA